MSRYSPTIRTNAPETLNVQPGQWIDYQGAKGRFYGQRNGTVYIAWSGTAKGQRWERFSSFARGNN